MFEVNVVVVGEVLKIDTAESQLKLTVPAGIVWLLWFVYLIVLLYVKPGLGAFHQPQYYIYR